MDNNWIIDNLNYAFGVWNDKLTEMWSLLSQSPQAFKGGTIWQTIQTVNGAMQGIGYGLLVLFLAIGIFRSSASFRDFQRPEHFLRHFIYFVMAKLAVTYGIDLMVDIFAVCAGIISAAAGSVGGIDGATVSLPVEIVTAIGDVGFLASIPLWLVTLLGCLAITVLAFLMILTVYGRFFRLYLYAALSPVALASFVGTLAVVLISRILTVRKKCPITIFLVSGIIPLVPGAGIYYTAYYLVTGQTSLAAVKGLEAVKIAFAIVLGIIFVVSIPRDVFQIRYWRAKRKRKRLKNHGNM